MKIKSIAGVFGPLIFLALRALADPPPPGWWTDTGNQTAIINGNATANNFGVLNVGQLKFTAYQAREYLDQQLNVVGGAGPAIDLLIDGNSTVAGFSTNATVNRRPANVGQLKYVALPFYNRLVQLGYNTKANLIARGYPSNWTGNYPWLAFPAGPGQSGYNQTVYDAWLAQQRGLANIGQLKMVFSFDLSNFIPSYGSLYGFYAWAVTYGLNPYDANLPTQSAAGDGITNFAKYLGGFNPTLYQYANAPTLQVIQGQTQTGNIGQLSSNVVVRVASGNSSLANVPVDYRVVPSGGNVVINGANSTIGQVRTDSQGNLTLKYYYGTNPVQFVHFSAAGTSATTSATFSLVTTGNGGSASGSSVSPGGSGALPTLDTSYPNADVLSVSVLPTFSINSNLTWGVENKVTVLWTTNQVDFSVSYQIERSEGNTGNWTTIGTVNGSAAGNFGDNNSPSLSTFNYCFNDTTTLKGGRRYIYRVTVRRGTASTPGASAYGVYLVPLIKNPEFLSTTVSVGLGSLFTPDDADPEVLPHQYYLSETIYKSFSDGTNPNDYSSGSSTEITTLTANTSASPGVAFDVSTSGTFTFHHYSYQSPLSPSTNPITFRWDDYLTLGSMTNGAFSGSTLHDWAYVNETGYDSGPDEPQPVTGFPSLLAFAGYTRTVSGEYTEAQMYSDLAAGVHYPDANDEDNWDGLSPMLQAADAFYEENGASWLIASQYRIAYWPSNGIPIYWYRSWDDVNGNHTRLGDVLSTTAGASGVSDVFEGFTAAELGNLSSLIDGNMSIIFLNPPKVIDQFGELDGYEASHNYVAVSTDADYRAAIDLKVDFPFDHLTISWTNGNSLRVLARDYYTSQITTITNGGNISSEDLWLLFDEDPFLVVANNSATPSQTFAFTINYYDADGQLLLSATPHFAYNSTSTTLSSDEGAGAGYRKLALNGRPLPDGKPQTESESDEQEEETFVDVLSLALRHQVSDIYQSLPGADLSLGVNRVYQEEIWSPRHGLRPHERPDLPFGLSWRSNIVSTARWEKDYSYSYSSQQYYETTPISDIFVTDENGNDYHFLAYYSSFVPYPTGKHEKKPYEAVLMASGNMLVLTKKYGTTVVYEPVTVLNAMFNDPDLGDRIPKDRLTGGGGYSGYSYYRLKTATDRAGNSLTYAYGSNTTLIPTTIFASGPANTTISIQQNNQGLVSKIWDSDGNEIRFGYNSVTDPASSGVVWRLGNVTYADNTMVRYDYGNITQELDTTPRPNSGNTAASNYDPGTIYYHNTLRGITDQNNHAYTFDYHFHYENGYGGGATGFRNFTDAGGNSSLAGYYPVPGRPMMVGNVTLPGNYTAHFYNDSLLSLADGGGGLGLGSGARRRTVVADTSGNITEYTWDSPSVMMLDVPSLLAQNNPGFSGQIVLWGNLTVTYKWANSTVLGSEVYTFDKEAGMALKSVADFSGNPTTYQYADAWTVPSAYTTVLPGVYDLSSGGAFGYYDDPTIQTNALGGNKTFGYNSLRLMANTTDELNRRTEYIFDGGGTLTKGLRTTELHYNGSTLVARTDFEYGNTSFPGVVTKRTVRSIGGDPSWARDLVVQYVLNAAGRVAQEIVDPGANGLGLTTSYTYSPAGDKLTSTDALGHKTQFFYDGRHRLTTVIYPDGSSRILEYDSRGNKISETDENGRATTYTYDALNRVTQATRVMDGANAAYNDTSGGSNLVTTYTYSQSGARTGVTDAYGRTTTFTYDPINRLLQTSTPAVSVNGGGGQALVTQYFYGSNSGASVFSSSGFKPTTVIDPRGYTTSVTYDALYRPVAESVQYGANTSVTAVTQKQYDAVGNLRFVTDPLNHTTEMQYDALNRPVAVIHPDATVSSTAYTSAGLAYQSTDELNRVTATVYDGAGRAVQVSLPDPASGAQSGNSPVIITTYDANGNALAVTNPLGQTTSYIYDARNRRIAEVLPAVEDWESGGAVKTPVVRTQYDAVGNALAVTDARGYTSAFAYDAANRKTYAFTPSVSYLSGGSTTTAYLASATGYDKVGNVIDTYSGTATAQSPGSASFPRHTAHNVYDALGRLTSTTDAAGITVTNQYDAAGNRVKMFDGLSNNTTFTYDGLNRLLTEKHGSKPVTTYVYDALNKVSRTNANAQVTNYFYDARNRLTTVVNVMPGSTSTLPPTMAVSRNLSYDAGGQLRSVRENLLGNTTLGNFSTVSGNVAYAYDGLGRQVTEAQGGVVSGSTMSGGFVNSYGYDAAGNRVSAVFGVGRGDARTLVSQYDALNRLTALIDVSGGNRVAYYRYNLGGGRVALVHPNFGNITTGFDALGRQVAIAGHGPAGLGTPYTYALAYDQFSNLARQTETYPDGNLAARTVNLTYDDANRLTTEQIVSPSTGSGQGNTTWTSNFTYDAAFNRTAKVVTQQIGSANATTLANITYSYYTGTNILATVTNTVPVTRAFNYSVDANGSPTQKLYVTGNMTGVSYIDVETFAYDYDNRLLLNARKKMTGGAGTVYTWYRNYYAYDYRTRRVWNRDMAETTNGSTVTVNFDKRTVAVFGGGTSQREYGGGNLTWTPGNTTMKATTEYVRGSDWGGGVGGVVYSLHPASGILTSNAPSYYHYDGRGDVVAQTNTLGLLTYQSAYLAFGHHNPNAGQLGFNPLASPAWGAQEWTASGANTDKLRANTKEEDSNGLVNYNRRYLNLETDRWLTEDSAGFVNGPNIWVTGGQNPWTNVDTNGLFFREMMPGWMQPIHNLSPMGALDDAIDGGIQMGKETGQMYRDSRASGSGVAASVGYAASYGAGRFSGGLGLLEFYSGEHISLGGGGLQMQTFDSVGSWAGHGTMSYVQAGSIGFGGAMGMRGSAPALGEVPPILAESPKPSTLAPPTSTAVAEVAESATAAGVESRGVNARGYGGQEPMQQQLQQQQQAGPPGNSSGLGRFLYKEIGQKTLPDAKYEYYSSMYPNPVNRGMALVEQYGWRRALLPEGRGWVLGAGKTFSTGPTPAGTFGAGVLAGAATAATGYAVYENQK